MNSEKAVYDARHCIIGWCKDYGDVINAVSFKHGLVGHYNKRQDITFDKSGKIFCFGDATQALILESEKN